MLLMLRPMLYHRPCEICQDYLYYEEGERLDRKVLHPEDSPDGQPVRRAWHKPPLCRTRKGCEKGTPESPKTLTTRNQIALNYHRCCELTGRWPEDELVVQRGVVIREVEEQCNRVLRTREMAQMASLMIP